MKLKLRLLLLALGLGVATFILIGFADTHVAYSMAKVRLIDAVSLPGALVAGLVYTEGVHTGYGAPLFPVFAMAANLLFYAAFWYVVFWLVAKARQKRPRT
jgi:hypothetical protein